MATSSSPSNGPCSTARDTIIDRSASPKHNDLNSKTEHGTAPVDKSETQKTSESVVIPDEDNVKDDAEIQSDDEDEEDPNCDLTGYSDLESEDEDEEDRDDEFRWKYTGPQNEPPRQYGPYSAMAEQRIQRINNGSQN